MKKLEALDNEKFKISEEELNQIKGGYSTSTWDPCPSHTYYYTGSSMDSYQHDFCVYRD